MNFDQIQTYKGMHHSTVLRKYGETIPYAFLLIRKTGPNPWAVVKTINTDGVQQCPGRESILLEFASSAQAKEFTSAGFTCVAGFDVMPSTEEEARAIVGFNGKPLTEFELNVLQALYAESQNSHSCLIYGFDKTQLNTQELPTMNSSRSKRLCPDTPIALMATGDTFRVGYVERTDPSGDIVVNCNGRFGVWRSSPLGANHLFVCYMDKQTQQYIHCNKEFVSFHQKEIAMYAISKFVQNELMKQQQGLIYREGLPVWVRMFENNSNSPSSVFETHITPNLSVPLHSTWKKNTSAQQAVKQEQFKDLWKAPEQKPFLNTQLSFKTHNFQQTPQFEEPGLDKSVTMKPVQSAPPGTFGKRYPEQWDMIQELILEARRVKAVLKNIEDHSSAVNETPKADSSGLAGDDLDALIRTVFLENGFSIKEGATDLEQCIFTAARQLLAAVGVAAR